jgi:hypothetical protein
MTSCAQHDDWFLQALRRAGDEDCPPLSADRQRDLEAARRMTPGERLAALNEIMLLVDAMKVPARTEETVKCSVLRL